MAKSKNAPAAIGPRKATNNRVTRRRSTKGDRVDAAIREMLAKGEIAPGEKISLRNLAATLGVSVMPVRNAVARLQTDGVLRVEPGRAVRVPVMTSEEFRVLLRTRIEIEGFAAEIAAGARDESDLKVIEALSRSFEVLGSSATTRKAVASRANMEFHFAIYRASKMPLLVDIIERLWLKAGPVVFYHIYLDRFSSASRDSVNLHAQAFDALRRSDGSAARKAVSEDIRQAGERLLAEGIFIDGTGKIPVPISQLTASRGARYARRVTAPSPSR